MTLTWQLDSTLAWVSSAPVSDIVTPELRWSEYVWQLVSGYNVRYCSDKILLCLRHTHCCYIGWYHWQCWSEEETIINADHVILSWPILSQYCHNHRTHLTCQHEHTLITLHRFIWTLTMIILKLVSRCIQRWSLISCRTMLSESPSVLGDWIIVLLIYWAENTLTLTLGTVNSLGILLWRVLAARMFWESCCCWIWWW